MMNVTINFNGRRNVSETKYWISWFGFIKNYWIIVLIKHSYYGKFQENSTRFLKKLIIVISPSKIMFFQAIVF